MFYLFKLLVTVMPQALIFFFFLGLDSGLGRKPKEKKGEGVAGMWLILAGAQAFHCLRFKCTWLTSALDCSVLRSL